MIQPLQTYLRIFCQSWTRRLVRPAVPCTIRLQRCSWRIHLAVTVLCEIPVLSSIPCRVRSDRCSRRKRFSAPPSRKFTFTSSRNAKKAHYRAHYYDRKHKLVKFKPGDLIWLNASNMCHPSKKLDCNQLGAFKIIERIGSPAYKLDLPPPMRHIHDVFHVSLLELYKPSSLPSLGLTSPLPTLNVKDTNEYCGIQDILDSLCVGTRQTQHLIEWKGYPDSDNSWELLTNIPVHRLVLELTTAIPMILDPSSNPYRCCQY